MCAFRAMISSSFPLYTPARPMVHALTQSADRFPACVSCAQLSLVSESLAGSAEKEASP